MKYYNLPSVVDVVLNRYIKEILKNLSETVPTLARIVPTQLTMKQRDLEADGKKTYDSNDKGEVIMPRYECVTTHTAGRIDKDLLQRIITCYMANEDYPEDLKLEIIHAIDKKQW